MKLRLLLPVQGSCSAWLNCESQFVDNLVTVMLCILLFGSLQEQPFRMMSTGYMVLVTLTTLSNNLF